MKHWNRVLVMAGTAVVLSMMPVMAQQERPERPGRGNFDPEQMRARMTERVREQLEVKDDAEWKLIQDRVDKVMSARREVGFGGGGMGFGGPGPSRGGRPGGDGAQGDDQGGRRFRGFGSESSPEVEELRKAIEAKASADELKAKLAKVREARKQKEVALTKAQEDLRKVLTARQEASAVLMGLLQ